MRRSFQHSFRRRRVAFLVGGGSRVPAILRYVSDMKNLELVFVLSCMGEGIGTEAARDHDIEARVIRWNDFRKEPQGRKKFSGAVARMLQERYVDFVIMAGWRIVMPKRFIEEFSGRIVNIHPSILPAYPGNGEKAIQAQWEDGANPAGCTLHFIDEGVDTGQVILRGFVNVSDYKSEREFAEAIHEKEEEVLCEALKLIDEWSM